MPTYRYRCGTCGNESEVWQSITDLPLTTHDGCGGDLVKVMSAAGIVLKGSGFYKTDNRGNGSHGKGGAERTDGAGAKDGSGKDTGSKDSARKDSARNDSSSKDSATSGAGKGKGSGASSSSSSSTKPASTGSS